MKISKGYLKISFTLLFVIFIFNACSNNDKQTEIMNGIYLGMTVSDIEEHEGKPPTESGATNVWYYSHTKYNSIEGRIEYGFIGETVDDYKLNSVTFYVPYFEDSPKMLKSLLRKQYGRYKKQDDGSLLWDLPDLNIVYYDIPDEQLGLVIWVAKEKQ